MKHETRDLHPLANAITTPPGRPCSSPRRHCAPGFGAGFAFVLASLVCASTALAAPGVELYHEDFENGLADGQVVLLSGYSGAGSENYDSEPNWNNPAACNGFVLDGTATNVDIAALGCTDAASENQLRNLVTILGTFNGSAPAASNHAVAAYTADPPSPASAVEFRTVAPLGIAVQNRFLTFSVNVVAINCQNASRHPLLRFSLDDGSSEIPMTSAPLNPCTAFGAGVAGTLVSNGAVLFDGTQLGIVMRNDNGATTGNDHAFDDIQVFDATPKLDKAFAPGPWSTGDSVPLTFTITNTDELAEKTGWSFTDTLPAGLTLAADGAVSTCAAADVTAVSGGNTIAIANGSIASGVASCTITVQVTAPIAGTFSNGPANLAPMVGLDPPGSTDVTFGPPLSPPLFFGCSQSTTFDTSSENWRNLSTNGFTVVNDYGIADWSATEGNPGGAAFGTDGDGQWQELWTPDLAANGYSTDYRFAIGSELRFDYRNDTGIAYDVYVAVEGANGERYFYVFRPQITDSTQWTHIRVPMDPAQWVKDFGANGPTGSNHPTPAEFEAVLADVDEFAFSIEGRLGTDTTYFDNFGACNVTVAKALTAESGTMAGIAEPGEHLTYTITLTNTTDTDATGYGATDALDPNVAFISADNGGTQNGTHVEWTGLTVPATGSLTLTVIEQVNDPIPVGVTAIGNVAYETGSAPPDCSVSPMPANCVEVPVIHAPLQACTADQVRATQRWWYFGNKGGIDFGTAGTTASAFTGVGATQEGSTVVSDTAGNLQFWSNGQQIYNRDGNVMPNGGSLSGNESATQTVASFPAIGQPGIYFVVTTSGNAGAPAVGQLNYSVVDMSLDGGLGDVELGFKDIPLGALGTSSEALTAVPNADGTGFWVLTFTPNSPNFLAYAFNDTGPVTGLAVVSPMSSNNFAQYGTINVSADLRSIVSLSSSGASGGPAIARLVDFDASSGHASERLAWNLPQGGGTGTYGYSADFSPSGDYVYATRIFGTGRLYRYDIATYTTAADLETHVETLGTIGTSGGQVRRAPDGRMYVANSGGTALSVVNTPDATDAGFVQGGFAMAAGTQSIFGLPQTATGCPAPAGASVTIAKALTTESGTQVGVAEPGEQLTYTITLTNSGGADATGYAVTDPLDPNVEFVSADNGGAHIGNDVEWSGLTVPAGGNLLLTVVVEVDNTLPPLVTAIGNVAYETGTTPPDCSVTPLPANCTSTPTPPTPPAGVTITKALSAESGVVAGLAEAGEQLSYTITLSNSGGADVTPYAVTDALDPNVIFVSADNGGTPNGVDVEWSGLTVPAGGNLVLGVVVQVVDPIPPLVTAIGNVAYETGTPAPDCSVRPQPINCVEVPVIHAPLQACTADQVRATQRWWYFGYRGVIDFGVTGNTATPLLNPQTHPAIEGSTVITDIAGNLLFWSNGQTLFDRNQNPMQNGDGLLGDPSATQTVAAFPAIGVPGRYFVVTTSTSVQTTLNGQLYYSVVDMGLNGGLGAVVTGEKNIALGAPDTASEALTAVPNADGTGFWVLTYTNSAPNLLAYAFDDAGPVGTAVVSTLSTNNGDFYGSLYFSAQSNMLAQATGSGDTSGQLRVLDFDAASGLAHERYTWPAGQSGGSLVYTADFSPAGDYLYMTRITGTGTLYRYRIAGATSAADVVASEEVIGPTGGGGGHVRRGADGRMYVVGSVDSAFLGVVNAPDDPLDPDFLPDSIALPAGVQVRFGLPQTVTGCPLPAGAFVTVAKALTAESGVVAGVAEAGEQLTYTITLTNLGSANATPYAVTDALDANVSFVSADNGGALGGGNVQWNGLTVPAGGTVLLHVTVQVDDPIPAGVAAIGNVAYETGSTPPDCSVTPRPANCTSTPVQSVWTAVKTVTSAGPTQPGDTVNYQIVISNTGGAALTGLVLDDDVSGVLDDASWNSDEAATSGTVSFTAPTLNWSGDLLAGASATVTYSVSVDDPGTGDGMLLNSVTGPTNCPGIDCSTNTPIIHPPLLTCTADETRATQRWWYFGNKAGIDFSTSGTTAATLPSNGISSAEGTTVVTDTAGNLVFWSNGLTVFNRNQVAMPSGGGLTGNTSATQTVAAFPSLTQPGVYFVVTTDAAEGVSGQLRYSVVDMSLDGGLGDVVVAQKNIDLGAPATSSEALTAVPNADGTGFWVLSFTYNSPNVLAYEFDGNGPVGAAVVSVMPTNNRNQYGSLNFSADLSQLVLATNQSADGGPSTLRLIDFDAATGAMFERYEWGGVTGGGTGNRVYTADFSPAGDYVYVSKIFGGGHLYRYRIAGATSGAAVEASVEDLGAIGTSGGQVRRGPDNRMYVANSTGLALSVVNDPDNVLDPDFASGGFALDPSTSSRFGLPQTVTGCPVPTVANVTIAKTLTAESGSIAGEAESGEQLTYAITLTNSGGSDAIAYGVTDTLDPNVTFASADNGGTAGAGVVTWSGLTVPANGTLVLTVVTTVNTPIPPGTGSIGNVAYETGTPPPACPPASAQCVTIPTAPNVTLVKALTVESGSIAGQAEPGESLTYTITLANSGGSDALNYGVTDTLDPNVAFFSADNGGTAGAGVVTWSGLTVPANGTLVLTVVTTVNTPIPAGVTAIGNVAYQTGTPPPACPPAGPQCVTIPTASNVTIAKTLTAESGSIAGEAESGEQLTYAITLTNSGGSDAIAYGVTDTLDPNVSFFSADNGGVAGAGVVTWSGLTVPANGTLVLTVVTTVNTPIPPGAGSIGNVAYETGTPPPACPPASAQCVTIPTAPNVTLVKALTVESGSIAGQAEPGESLTYTITLANSGGSDALNYGVTDTLDPNVAFFSADNGGTAGAGVVTWSGLTVPANGTLVLTVVTSVNTPIPAGVTAIGNVAYQTGTPPPACPPAGMQCVVLPTVPQVTITKTATAPSATGGPKQFEITYTLTATNGGGSSGSYDLSDAITFNGANVSVISAPLYSSTTGDTQNGTLGVFVAPSGGSIVTGEDIGAQGVETWSYTVAYTITDPDVAADCADPAGGLRNHAELGGASAGAPPADTCTGAPSVNIVKTTGAPVPTGSPNEFTLTYTIDVNNTGSLPGVYNLSDTFDFNGATVTAISAPTYASTSGDTEDGAPGTLTPPAGGNIVTGETISVSGTETWTYTVTYTVDDAGLAQDCTDPAGGLRNDAELGGSLIGQSTTCTGAADIAVGKSVSGPDATGNPDEYTLTYMVTVQNNGSIAGSYDLGDAFTFPGVTVVSVSAITHGGGDPLATPLGVLTPTGGSIVTSESIAAGASENYTYGVVFTVDDATAVGDCSTAGGLRNQAMLGGSASGQVSTCSGVPHVFVDKSANAPLPTGTLNQYAITYNVAVDNDGTANGIYDLADAFTFAGATIDAVSAVTHAGTDPLDTTLGTLTPAGGSIVTGESIIAGQGETYTYTVTFTVTDPAAANDCAGAGGLRNAATLGGSATGTSGTCSGVPDVALVKTLTGESGSLPGIAEPGEQLTYTITLTNSGNADASAYGVSDTLDPNVGFVSADNGGTQAGGVVTWSGLAVPAHGSLVLTVITSVVAPIPPGTAAIGNVAYQTGTPPPTCPPAGPQCVTIPTAPNVTLAKALTGESGSIAGEAEPGEQLTYAITLTNTGGSAALNVGMTDPLDANVGFVSADNGGAFAGGVVTWSGLTVPANGTLVLTVVTMVHTPIPPGTATIGNVAYQTGTSPPDCSAVPQPANCVVIPTAANIAIAKSVIDASGNGIAEPGEQLTYTITLTNSGGSDALNYGVTDPLDANVGFVSADHGGTQAGGVVTWSGLTIPANGTLVLTVVTTVHTPIPPGTATIGNVAYQTGTSPPACGSVPQPTNCVVIPTAANVTLAKSVVDASGNGVAEAGEQLTYTITLTNSGGSDASGYGVTDPLDANTTFVSADHGGNAAGGVVTWSALTVPANGTLALAAVVTVNTPISDGVTTISNVVYETGTSPPACPSASPQCAQLPSGASLAVSKALTGESIDPDGIAQPGEELTYTLTVWNQGGTPATGVLVNERVPQNTTFVGGAPAWNCALGAVAGTACDALVNVPASNGTSPGLATLTFMIKVDDPLPSGITSIANGVAINDQAPPDCIALPSQPQCVVVPTVNLSLVKSVLSVMPTGPNTYRVLYQLDVTNTGGSPSVYTLTDTLGFTPDGVVFNGDAEVTTSDGTLNPALPGGRYTPANGVVVQLSDGSVSLAAGDSHTYLLQVPFAVVGTLENGDCTGGAGNGLYNQAALSGSLDLTGGACAPVNGDLVHISLVKTVALDTDNNRNHLGDAGDVLRYDFSVGNTGTVPLSPVQLFDPRVSDLTCEPRTDQGLSLHVLGGVDELFASGFEAFDLGSLDPGDFVDCRATYVLTQADVDRHRVSNTATAAGAGPGGQVASATSTAIFTAFP